MKKTLLFLFSVLINVVSVFGQESIQTDRPDQTESSYLVPAGTLQFESGMNYERPGNGSEVLVHPTLLWRLGLNDRFELRLISDLTTQKINDASSFGLDPLAVGFKANLLEERGWIPRTSFIAHLTLPWAATENRIVDNHYPDFRFTFLNNVSEKVALGYNVGAQWDGISASPTFLYTFAPCFVLGEKLGCYIEAFGYFPEDRKADHRIDAGFTYLVNSDAQLDLSAGKTLTETSSEAYYVSLGFSWRWKLTRQ
ncbi:MAG: transporter [Bacteroidota bacterium]